MVAITEEFHCKETEVAVTLSITQTPTRILATIKARIARNLLMVVVVGVEATITMAVVIITIITTITINIKVPQLDGNHHPQVSEGLLEGHHHHPLVLMGVATMEPQATNLPVEAIRVATTALPLAMEAQTDVEDAEITEEDDGRFSLERDQASRHGEGLVTQRY